MADVDRHRDLLRRLAGVDVVVLLLAGLNAKQRKRLIERRVAFMAPGAQLYVPEMLLDQREHFRAAPPAAPERFSPTAQVVAIAALLGREIDGENATALARRFGVAPMSMGRALDELEAAGVVDAHRIGRQRQVRMKMTGGELWRAVENRLQSPVRKVRGVVIPYPQEVRALVAGESALASYTALASPRTQRLAIAAADWNRASRAWGLQPAERFDPRRDEIETWSYDPACLARDNVVDPLSLYLSVRDSRDERVAQAADQLLETMPW
ncbi:hypothetical protein [Caulobacter sp. 17J65-9]|uniref:hypothetical protein n=1 Tax=Caulobacter sp. 17J65-9 TaxID=2709382 RepID=UPI001969BE32|nr:hypothetical protein [Caulobacter sp. 17J65-9]